MIKTCTITNNDYDWRQLRKVDNDNWVLSVICREAGHYFSNGVPSLEQIRNFYEVRQYLRELEHKTLLTCAKLASLKKTSIREQLKAFLQQSDEYMLANYAKGRKATTMLEDMDFMIKFIGDNFQDTKNTNPLTKNYLIYHDALTKDRNYYDWLEE